MTTDRPKTFTVLAAVDYSELSGLVLTNAIAAARVHELSHVHVVHVVQPLHASMGAVPVYVPETPDTTLDQASDDLRKYVDTILDSSGGSGGGSPDGAEPFAARLTMHIRMPYAAEAIAQLASDIEADLVVVGTHGRRGVARILLGSVAEGVVRLAPCPVLVVRPVGTTSANVPKIEPPCPQCVETRRATDGKEFWCAEHNRHHERRHTYHFGSARSGHQSGLLFHTSPGASSTRDDT